MLTYQCRHSIPFLDQKSETNYSCLCIVCYSFDKALASRYFLWSHVSEKARKLFFLCMFDFIWQCQLSGLKRICITEACSYKVLSYGITQCSPLKVSRRLWGTCRFRLQQREAGSKQSKLATALRWFLSWRILLPWGWRRYVPPKRRLTFNGLHGVISQKIQVFITTAVRASKLALLLPVFD
jgi:hypothetical protein